MSYEDSKAARELNSRCTCCNRALVDAVSVELEMGPICREKKGVEDRFEVTGSGLSKMIRALEEAGDEDLRVQVFGKLRTEGPGAAVNKLIHRAVHSSGKKRAKTTEAIKSLGFNRVASKLKKRG